MTISMKWASPAASIFIAISVILYGILTKVPTDNGMPFARKDFFTALHLLGNELFVEYCVSSQVNKGQFN